jgi:hypothetical protein
MTGPKKSRVQRIGVVFYALCSAVLVAIAIPEVPSGSYFRVLLLLFSVVFFVASLYVWNWVFFIRPTELNKKLPIGSKELRRREKAFYDRL